VRRPKPPTMCKPGVCPGGEKNWAVLFQRITKKRRKNKSKHFRKTPASSRIRGKVLEGRAWDTVCPGEGKKEVLGRVRRTTFVEVDQRRVFTARGRKGRRKVHLAKGGVFNPIISPSSWKKRWATRCCLKKKGEERGSLQQQQRRKNPPGQAKKVNAKKREGRDSASAALLAKQKEGDTTLAAEGKKVR